MTLVLIGIALAAYRVTRLITLDDVAEPIRNLWFKRFPPNTKPGMFIVCPYCVGVYVSALFLVVSAIAFPHFRHWWTLWLAWPAIAGAQSLLNAVDERLNK